MSHFSSYSAPDLEWPAQTDYVPFAARRGELKADLNSDRAQSMRPGRGRIFLCCLFVVATTFLLADRLFASVTITAATGGTNISADKAANASSPAWTTLGPIVIAERNKFDFSAGSGVTLVFRAPAGFEFNTSSPPNITFTSGQDITSASISFSNSSNLAITLNVGGTSGTDQLTIGNTNSLQVRPTAGTPLASGQLFRPQSGGGSAVISGITTSTNTDGSGGSNFGSLSEVVGSAIKLAFTIQPGAARTGAIFGTQ